MFAELLPILRNRPVMLTLALVGDNAIRVNVIPKRLKDSDSGDDEPGDFSCVKPRVSGNARDACKKPRFPRRTGIRL